MANKNEYNNESVGRSQSLYLKEINSTTFLYKKAVA